MKYHWIAVLAFIANGALAQTQADEAQSFYDVEGTQVQQLLKGDMGELVPPEQSTIKYRGQAIRWRDGKKSYTVLLYRPELVKPLPQRHLILNQQVSTESAGQSANETLIERQARNVWWSKQQGFSQQETTWTTLRTQAGDRYSDHILSGAGGAIGDSQGSMEIYPDGRQVMTEVRSTLPEAPKGYRLLSVTDVTVSTPKKDFVLTGLDPVVREGIEQFSVQHAITREKYRLFKECEAQKGDAGCFDLAKTYAEDDAKRDTLWAQIFPTANLRVPAISSVKERNPPVVPDRTTEQPEVAKPKVPPKKVIKKPRRRVHRAPSQPNPPANSWEDDDWFHF